MSHCVGRSSMSIYPTMFNENNRGNVALSFNAFYSIQCATVNISYNETNRGNVVLSVNAFYSIYWVIVLVGPVCRYILQYPMRLTEVMWSCLSIHSIESSESLCCRCILQWSLRLIEVMLSCLSIHSNVSLCWPLKSVDISFNVQWDQ